MSGILPQRAVKVKCRRCGWHLICQGGGCVMPPHPFMFGDKCPKCGGEIEFGPATAFERLNPIELARAAYHLVRQLFK